MAQYLVELTGEAREVFMVEADSPEEAEANWADGHSVVLEASGMSVASVTLEED